MKAGCALVISVFLIFFSFFSFSDCFGQPVASPEVKCLAVNPANGDVTLYWTIPSDPGFTFLNYQIYASTSATGPYALAGIVNNYAQNMFTHMGAGANTIRMYYLVQTESSGFGLAAPQDTFSTMFLTVANVTGNAQLNWNKISIKPVSTSSGWYKIYREYPAGNWMLRDSTQNTNYLDITDVCNPTNQPINYRIETPDNTGCLSLSNQSGTLLLNDNTPPLAAPIDTVSVNASNLATISWFPSSSPDADSAYIYLGTASGGPWNKIAAVKMPQNVYTYALSNAANASEYYRVAFLDSCNNLSPLVTFHRTIFLDVNFDVCASAASLVWNSYINMNPPLMQYEIYRSINAGAYTLLAVNTANDTAYTDNTISLGNDYCYMIRATNGSSKTTSSNRVCFNANVSQPPQYTYSRYATVISDKFVALTAHVDPAQGVKYYNLERATGNNGNFSIIKTLPKTGSTLSYADNSVSAATEFYSYRWAAMDSCNNVIMTSNTATTMLLTATIAPNLEVMLSWNDYGTWLGAVDEYKVYRAIDGAWDPVPIGTVSYTGNGGTFTDDVSPYFTSTGIFSYRVIAIEKNVNAFGFKDSSASNVARVFQYPKIYVPNAFTPNGDMVNDIFMPVVGFFADGTYTLTVFDRTGTPVFSTTNPAEGWDGKKKNRPCPEGVYMYLIQCKASNGDDTKVSGTISLIR